MNNYWHFSQNNLTVTFNQLKTIDEESSDGYKSAYRAQGVRLQTSGKDLSLACTLEHCTKSKKVRELLTLITMTIART